MDRLPQLQRIAGLTCAPHGGRDKRKIDQDACDALDAFYADAEKVAGTMREMENLTVQLLQRHSENIQTVDETRSKALRSEIEQLSEEVSLRAKAAKEGIDAMNARTATLKDPPEMIEGNSSVIRIQENISAFMVTRLTMVMAEYQRHQETNQKYYKAQTFRQIKIGYTNPDGSTIDDATAESLTMQVMENNMTSYVFEQSQEQLALAIERRNDVLRIESAMAHLNRLYADLAFLVHEQQEGLDLIQANLKKAQQYVEGGNREMKKARKYQKMARQKECSAF